MEMHKSFHMIGGEDEASYAKNSSQQRLILREVKPILEKCIEELLGDMEDLPSSCIKVGDLGCSSGPNTFFTLHQIIETIDKACKIKNQEPLTIQYFMNDLVSTDFNLVFKGLPPFYEKLEKENGGRQYGSCLVAAMPGTFYGKLFPDCSMHFLHSSYSLHWLSQCPSGLVTELGIPMNKGSIYCGKTSPPIVHKLYLDQFTQDFSIFLRMRSQEMIQHGQLLLTFLCENSEELDGSNPSYLYLMGMALRDLVMEGNIEEEKLDTFNLPIYEPPLHETKQIIENEGSFRILKFHTFQTRLDASYEISKANNGDDHNPFDGARHVATHLRAIFQPVLASRFGEAIMDDLFHRCTNKLVNILQKGHNSSCNNLVISLRKE